MRVSRIAIVVGAAGFASAALGAAPDVKTGLWERTVTRQMEGAPVAPVADLSKLPPEQRARIEQMLAARGTTAPTTTVARYCVTPETAQNWETFAPDERENPTCQRTVQDATSRSLRMSIACDGGKQTGTIEIAAASADRVTGTMEFVRQEERGVRKVRIDLDSRFLSPDCGAVKPEAPVRVKG
jgi:hypothetical protein